MFNFVNLLNFIPMKTHEKIAVFMDHSKARLISCENGVAHFTEIIESGRASHQRNGGEGSNQTRFGSEPYFASNDEYSRHNQEKELKRTYFQHLKDRLKSYEEILLFGAGTAKKEMLHYLHDQNGFPRKKIHVENSDYLTDNQLLEIVRNYFFSKPN